MKILLVEDNPGLAFLVEDILAELDAAQFELKHVEKFNEAVKYLAQEQVDVVLLDLALPDTNRLDTVKRMRATAPELPIVVLTSFDDKAYAVQALREGAQDYLIKGEAHGRLLVRILRYAIERKHGEQERERLIEELDAFAHMVAHDLKNPMFVLTATAQLLIEESETMPPEQLSHSLQTIVWNGRKMNNIVDGLLLLASIRQQQVAIQPLDMDNIIAEARQRLGHLIETRQAQIIVPSSWPRALGYSLWVEEVWVNYLSNAIKYGGQPPHLELGATDRKDGLVCFWIRDNGPGLTPEQQAKLFTPFTRLNQVQTQGHGLGLSIARRIVEKLGGQVGVASDGRPGQGTVFSFTLPVAPN